MQITEASPELQRQGHLGSASLSSSLPLRAEEGKGFEGSLLHHMNKKIASQLSPLASGKGPLSFARRRGHRKSNSLGEKYAHHTWICQVVWRCATVLTLFHLMLLQLHSKCREFTGKAPDSNVRSTVGWVLTVVCVYMLFND